MPLEKSWEALKVAGRVLDAPLGICTLDPEDWNYNGDYFNDNDGYEQKTAKGWNYHQVGFSSKILKTDYFRAQNGCGSLVSI